MPAAARPRRQPTDDWQQLRLLVTYSEQAAYELVRPNFLFGQTPAASAYQTGVSERTLRRKVARFADAGMRSFFERDEPASDRQALPLGIRRAIVAPKAEYPPLSLHQIATICEHRFERAVSHHTVKQVLATEPQPFLPALDETDWHPAQPLIPYRPRRPRRTGQPQPPLFAVEEGMEPLPESRRPVCRDLLSEFRSASRPHRVFCRRAMLLVRVKYSVARSVTNR